MAFRHPDQAAIALGIDPGANGALVFLAANGDVLAIEDTPSITVKVGKTNRTRVASAALASLIRERMPVHAFVENVGAMPSQGAASMFAFGKAAGIVEGALAGLRIPVTFITPQAWKKAAGIGADKGHARRRAMELFPGWADLFLRAKDDGRAEAALIAWHGLQSMRAVPG